MSQFNKPPVLKNFEGNQRSAGWELEFSNISVDNTAQLVCELFGGKVDRVQSYYQKVTDTSLGEFTIKFDTRLLTEKSYRRIFHAMGINTQDWQIKGKPAEQKIESILEEVATRIIPVEIVTPAIGYDQFDSLEELRFRLNQEGAIGTDASFMYAFATHINPDLPDLSVECFIHYLQAFMLVYPWLMHISDIDLSRRLTQFIDPFPESYIRLILSSDYQPEWDQFLSDYHEHNPDRNRPLDMYPAFAFVDAQVAQFDDIGKLSPRPTFHYRLPDCRINDSSWNLAQIWNKWVEVERLAHNQRSMEMLFREYWHIYHTTTFGFNKKWAQKMQEMLEYEEKLS